MFLLLPRPERQSTQPSGFTLIELLIVIAIIAILAGILFPVFARTRENARRSACQSNLKQIGLGVMQYTQDYDERYPFENFGANGSTFYTNDTVVYVTSDRFQNYQPLVYPYIKNKQVFLCPSSTVWTSRANQFRFNYAANVRITAPNAGDSITKTVAQINEPSTTMFSADTTNEWIDSASRIHVRHFDGANILYCDGHVKWHPKAYITQHAEMHWPGLTSWGSPSTNCPTDSSTCS